MPLARYQIRNEYGLADPELYNSADGDDPEALLEGVAMAGLVGVLRQLGDLAQFAAEIFHDLHEEVMSTTSRGHALLLRVQQVEAEFPYVEKAIHCQTEPSHFPGISGVDWHANFREDQNLITQGDMPRFILDFYEECRGPPRLFMLDKFDIAGAGACLKRYSDPSFCKTYIASSDGGEEDVQRERKGYKMKKKGLQRKNGETLESLLSPKKDSSLLPEMPDKVTEKTTTRRVKIKSRSLKVADTYRSYMAKLFEENLVEHEILLENTRRQATKTMDFVEASQSIPEIEELVKNPSASASVPKEIMPSSSPAKEVATLSLKESKMIETENADSSRVAEMPSAHTSLPLVKLDKMSDNTGSIRNSYHDQSGDVGESSCIHEVHREELLNDDDCNKGNTCDGYISDDVTVELENYVDALNSMDSEAETDNEGRTKRVPDSVVVDYQESNSFTDKKQSEVNGACSESTSVELSASLELNNLYKDEVPTISNHDSFGYLTGSLSTEGDNHASDGVTNLDNHVSDGVEEIESSDDCIEYADCRTSVGLKEAKEIELASSVQLSGFSTSYIKGTNVSSLGLETAEASEPSSKECYIVPRGSQDDDLANVLTANKTLVIYEQDTPELVENIYPDHPGALDVSEVFSPANNSGLPTVQENCITDSVTLSENPDSGDEKGSLAVACLLPNYAECFPHSETSPEVEPKTCLEQDSEAVLDKCMPSIVGTSGSVRNSTTMQFKDSPSEMNNTVQPIEDIENLTSGIDSECDGEFVSNADVMEAEKQACARSSMLGPLPVLEESFQSSTIPITEPHDTHGADELKSFVSSESSYGRFEIDSAIRDEMQMGTTQSDHTCGVTENDSCSIYSREHSIGAFVCLQEVNDSHSVDRNCHNMEAFETTMENDDLKLDSDNTHSLPCSDKILDGANNIPEQDSCSDLPCEGSLEHEFGTFIYPGGVRDRLSHHIIDDVELPKQKDDKDLNAEGTLHEHLTYKDSFPRDEFLTQFELMNYSGSRDAENEVVTSERECNLHSEHGRSNTRQETEDIFSDCIASTPEPRYFVSKEIVDFSSSDCQEPEALMCSQNTSSVDLSSLNTTVLPSFHDCYIGMLESTSVKVPELMADELITSLSLPDLAEAPPLPPLPPLQWRICKPPSGERHSDENAPNGAGQNPFTWKRHPRDLRTTSHETGMLPDIFDFLKETEEKARLYSGSDSGLLQPMLSEPLPISGSVSYKNDDLLSLCASVHPSNPPTVTASIENNDYFAHDLYTLHQSNPFAQLLAAENQIPQFSSERIHQHGSQDSYNERPKVAEVLQDSPHIVNDDLQRLNPYWIVSTQNAKEYFGANGCENLQPVNVLLPLQNIGPMIPHNSASFIGQNPFDPYHMFEHAMDDEKPVRKRSSILDRPRSPLIEAVASHDKSTLRKVADMVRPVAKPKDGEKNTWLEQIKNKTFNLKPMAVKKSSVKGPTTNLKVAAILEKASSIRQACVGSDDDDNEDWSDP